MAKYKTQIDNSGYDSGYESDGGTSYSQPKRLGSGNYSLCRILSSTDGLKHKIVLNPINSTQPSSSTQYGFDYDEVVAKARFFKTLYPSADVQLFISGDKTHYRLILPLLPGKAYNTFENPDYKQLLKLFLAAVRAVKTCHAKGLTIVDLKGDNLLFNNQLGNCILIDGGFSALTKQEYVKPSVFKRCQREVVQIGNTSCITLEGENLLNHFRQRHPHIAPECWSQYEVFADAAMDVYSLGDLLMRMSGFSSQKTIWPAIVQLIEWCKQTNPLQRPTIDILEKKVEELSKVLETELLAAKKDYLSLLDQIEEINGDFSKLTTLKEVQIHKKEVLNQVDKICDAESLKRISYLNPDDLIPIRFAIMQKKDTITRNATQVELHIKDQNSLNEKIQEHIAEIKKFVVTFPNSNSKISIQTQQKLLLLKLQKLVNTNLGKNESVILALEEKKREITTVAEKLITEIPSNKNKVPTTASDSRMPQKQAIAQINNLSVDFSNDIELSVVYRHREELLRKLATQQYNISFTSTEQGELQSAIRKKTEEINQKSKERIEVLNQAQQTVAKYIDEIKNKPIDFSGMASATEINNQSENLGQTLAALSAATNLLQAYKFLSIEKDTELTRVLEEKKNEIKQKAQSQLKLVDVLVQLKFDEHYKNFELKARDMRRKVEEEKNDYYVDGANTARQFCKELQEAKKSFLRGSNPEQFQKSCLDAIQKARPVLDKHREWRGAIAAFFLKLLSILTFGIFHSQLSFFAKAHSGKMLTGFETELNNSAIAIPSH
ncbi:hypothetical protein [Legionella septentrionalis]|uniref:hypothetical protein n=1 Tax=Legionella septentrionalis TaxID=2498109 RepID=UPI000F8E8FA0|nr:hypothetical protein [Legionella septentrionalis]RUR08886.1 hypothetical protein ELY14_10340 [Legionella septentrionalis]